MQGDLATTSAVDLCLRLADQAATGILVLSAVTGQAQLGFVDGQLADGRAPTSSPRGERLGDRLVGAGRLDPADLDAVLAEQAAGGAWIPLGQRLVDRGVVSVDVVRLALQEQALDALQEAAGWFEGSFRFEERAPTAGVRVAMPLERVLREVARRTDDRQELALQAVGQAADREGTAPSREEFDLSASPTTGTRPVGLADEGWADRLDTTPPAPDEPEPWVGWANGARTAEEPASTPAPPPAAPHAATPPSPANEPTAPAASSYVPSAREEAPIAPPAPPAADSPATPTSYPQPAPPAAPLDADTRRAMFSELHEMGRPTPARDQPTPPATPQVQPPPPQPQPEVESRVEPGVADTESLEIEPPSPPPASLSRSDVSELLAELHALNLDDD